MTDNAENDEVAENLLDHSKMVEGVNYRYILSVSCEVSMNCFMRSGGWDICTIHSGRHC